MFYHSNGIASTLFLVKNHKYCVFQPRASSFCTPAPSSWLTVTNLPPQNTAQLLNGHGSAFACASVSTRENTAGISCAAQYARSFSILWAMNGHWSV